LSRDGRISTAQVPAAALPRLGERVHRATD
jgi:hypothetical protein